MKKLFHNDYLVRGGEQDFKVAFYNNPKHS